MMKDGSWIKVENLSSILDHGKPKLVDPMDVIGYRDHWRNVKATMINGVWVEQFGKMRYVPGRVLFFGNYCYFEEWHEETKRRVEGKPKVRDLEWHRFYYRMIMDGFSGYSEAPFTCFEELLSPSFNLERQPKYVKENILNKNGTFKEYCPPMEALFELHNRDLGYPLYHNQALNFSEMGSRGGGKEMPDYTEVLTPLGKVRLDALSIGDKVIGLNGKPTEVTAVFPQGEKDVYEIEFTDGRVVECGLNHQWGLFRGGKDYQVVTTEKLLSSTIKHSHKKSGYTYMWKLPEISPVQYGKKQLPINPYLLGLLLGNGALTTSTPKLALNDEESVEYVRQLLPDYEISWDKHTNNNYTIVYRGSDKYTKYDRYGCNPLYRDLLALGLIRRCGEKFVPDIYKQASIDQRLDLLRGLMDTDGSVNKNGYSEFSNTNLQLINDVAEIARSLGMRCQIGEDKREGQQHEINGWEGKRSKYYRLYIRSQQFNPFRLSRKADRWKPSKSVSVSIKDVRKTDRFTSQRCIMVDAPNHLFLVKDYIPTHNSYSKILGGFLYDVVFDGEKHYEPGSGKPNSRSVLEITAGQEAKSAETLAKMQYAMDQFFIKPELGVWGDPDDPRSGHTPIPFWKRMEGSLEANNRKNPWINEYSVDKGTKGSPKWVKEGSRSVVYHTVYPATEQGGAQKSAGGRRTYVLHEEMGLNKRLIEAWMSNEGLISGDGKKYASQEGIGTSGNIQMVQQARRVFDNPKEFKALALPNDEDPQKPSGFFLPVYMTDVNFKDENGNTDVEAARRHHETLHAEVMANSQMDVYIEYAMNYPIYRKHMWMQLANKLLPSAEAEMREAELLKGDLYKKIGFPVTLQYDATATHKISYKPDPNALPFYQWPLEHERKTLEAVFMMYIEPDKLMVNGRIPDDMIIVTYDPYISDEWNKGGSLGVAHFVVSPKYIPQGFPGHKIAATYIGKHSQGLDEFNKTLLMGAMMYGRPQGGIWYEANRGSDLRSMAIHMKCLDMLCVQPQFADGKYIYEQNTRSTGFVVGNNIAKSWLLTRLKHYLLSSSTSDGLYKPIEEVNEEDVAQDNARLIIQTMDCIFTLRQIKVFNEEGNFDAVSSLMGLPLAIGEMAHHVQKKSSGSAKPLSLLSSHLAELKKNQYGMVIDLARSGR